MAKLHRGLGIRLVDVGITAGVAAAVELNVAVASGQGQAPLDGLAYAFGLVVALPILLRRRWPLQVLIACSLLLLIFYSVHRRNISPVPLLAFPLYDAAVAGYLAWAIVIPAIYMAIGLVVVQASQRGTLITLASEFLPELALLVLAIMLGDNVRSRRALAAQTADRLRLAEEEREAETGRRVAEERLRIARELHDTIAHSMATITVQAGSALHRIGGAGAADPSIQAALAAIRDTSKTALADMRVTLGSLRGGDADVDDAETRLAGLDRLDALADAVRAAGAPVSLEVSGDSSTLPASVDHAAYRILQESLTNVLRHAGPDARAAVCLRYAPDALTIRVTDDGIGPSGGNANGLATGGPAANSGATNSGATNSGVTGGAAAGGDGGAGHPGHAGGHGLDGMSERAAAVGGRLSAGPRDSGGFEVVATLPVASATAVRPDASATCANSATPAGPAG